MEKIQDYPIMVLGIQNLDFMNVEQISIPNMSDQIQKDQYIKG